MTFPNAILQLLRWFRPEAKGDAMSTAGELAVAEALRLWNLDVYDPPKSDKSERAVRCRAVIDDILRASGWTWEVPYLGDGQVQWCGLFAAACWRKAGIDPSWLSTFWASTLRLDAWARGKSWNGKAAGGPRPFVKLDASSKPEDCLLSDTSLPKTGDIVIVGDGKPAEGDHIVLCERYDTATGVFETVGGNGVGFGPTGTKRQGVVKADFRVGGGGYCVRLVLRPLPGDLL